MLLPSELKSAQPRDCGICCDSNMKGTEGPLAGPALPPSAQMKEKVGMEEWMDRREIKGRFLSLSLSLSLSLALSAFGVTRDAATAPRPLLLSYWKSPTCSIE